jgi:uncharacterized protein YbdZ (MbtH family)
VKPISINALAKLRDDKAVPDGWDMYNRIEVQTSKVKARASDMRPTVFRQIWPALAG